MDDGQDKPVSSCEKKRNQYNLENLLSYSIREHGAENFKKEILEIVRGKQNAHNRERELIAVFQPELNMEGMGRKVNSLKVAA